ncbi:hypothetical protein [Nocardia niwae]|uniref:Uncharacterized protein n=1 Tax=Nocardia niwae TaxID=626084 RepID=A0ABV2X330_9NOCA
MDLSICRVVRVRRSGQPFLRRVEVVNQQCEAFAGGGGIRLLHRGHQLVEVAEHVLELAMMCPVDVCQGGVFDDGIELGCDAFAYQSDRVHIDSGQQAEETEARLRLRWCDCQRGDDLLDPFVGRSVAVHGLGREPLSTVEVRMYLSVGGVVGVHQGRQPFRGGVEVMDQRPETLRCDGSLRSFPHRAELVEMSEHVVQTPEAGYVRWFGGYTGIEDGGISFGRDALANQFQQCGVDRRQQLPRRGTTLPGILGLASTPDAGHLTGRRVKDQWPLEWQSLRIRSYGQSTTVTPRDASRGRIQRVVRSTRILLRRSLRHYLRPDRCIRILRRRSVVGIRISRAGPLLAVATSETARAIRSGAVTGGPEVTRRLCPWMYLRDLAGSYVRRELRSRRRGARSSGIGLGCARWAVPLHLEPDRLAPGAGQVHAPRGGHVVQQSVAAAAHARLSPARHQCVQIDGVQEAVHVEVVRPLVRAALCGVLEFGEVALGLPLRQTSALVGDLYPQHVIEQPVPDLGVSGIVHVHIGDQFGHRQFHVFDLVGVLPARADQHLPGGMARGPDSAGHRFPRETQSHDRIGQHSRRVMLCGRFEKLEPPLPSSSVSAAGVLPEVTQLVAPCSGAVVEQLGEPARCRRCAGYVAHG